jgi:hypothetical protein
MNVEECGRSDVDAEALNYFDLKKSRRVEG